MCLFELTSNARETRRCSQKWWIFLNLFWNIYKFCRYISVVCATCNETRVTSRVTRSKDFVLYCIVMFQEKYEWDFYKWGKFEWKMLGVSDKKSVKCYKVLKTCNITVLKLTQSAKYSKSDFISFLALFHAFCLSNV